MHGTGTSAAACYPKAACNDAGRDRLVHIQERKKLRRNVLNVVLQWTWQRTVLLQFLFDCADHGSFSITPTCSRAVNSKTQQQLQHNACLFLYRSVNPVVISYFNKSGSATSVSALSPSRFLTMASANSNAVPGARLVIRFPSTTTLSSLQTK